MNTLLPIYFYLIVIVCFSYITQAWIIGNTKKQPNKLLHLWLATTFTTHALISVPNTQYLHGIFFGFGATLSLLTLLTAIFYWMESWLYRLNTLLSITLLFAALATPLPFLFTGPLIVIYDKSIAFRVHFIIAMLAYAFVTLSAIHASVLLCVLRQLKKSTQPSTDLPPLLTLETLLFKIVKIAFILLSGTLITGILFSTETIGKALPWSHKTLFSILAWITFTILLIGRSFYGWRGKLAAKWVIAGFLTMLLAYIGVSFVREILLHKDSTEQKAIYNQTHKTENIKSL